MDATGVTVMHSADAAVALWPFILQHHAKGKLTPPGDAERHLASLGHGHLDDLEEACLCLQAWCWLRGMPPIDRLVAHPRTQGPVREAWPGAYDAFALALGVDVHTERAAMAYPWPRVRPPTPRQLQQAAEAVAGHRATIQAWRALELEAELREQDAAKGRRRAVPEPFASWDAVTARLRALEGQLAAAGLAPSDLRPPGQAPYPPRPGPTR